MVFIVAILMVSLSSAYLSVERSTSRDLISSNGSVNAFFNQGEDIEVIVKLTNNFIFPINVLIMDPDNSLIADWVRKNEGIPEEEGRGKN